MHLRAYAWTCLLRALTGASILGGKSPPAESRLKELGDKTIDTYVPGRGIAMSGTRTFRLLLAVIIAFPVLRAVPAYSWHGSGNITALAIDPQRPTTLYAGTSDRGVFKTTDGGATWSATGLANVYVSALAIDPVTPTTLYAVAWGGLYKSTDGGANWNPINDLTGVGVSSLAIDPQTPTTLYGWTYHDGVFKSTDGGASWSATGLTGVGGGILALAIDPLTPTTLYAGTDAITFLDVDGSLWYTSGDVSKSTDGGATWGAVGLASEALQVSVSDLAIDPLTPTTLYAGTNYGPNAAYSCGVFKSTDGGASWNVTGLTSVGRDLRLAIDPLIPTTLYAGAGASGVYKSTDGGLSWTPTGLETALSSVSLNPSSVTAGSTSTGTATLSAAAPSGGAVVALSSSNPSVATVPASVTVPAGATSASFTVSTSGVAATTAVTISGAYGGVTKSAVLTVTSPTLSSVSLNPTSVPAGSASTGTVTLSAAAPVGGAMVALSSSNTAVAIVPASVTVPAGATSANFTVATAYCTSGSVAISGTYGGITKSAELTVTLPVTDSITIRLADYFASRRELRVAAKSTSSSARLWLYVTSTGELIGELTNLGDGRYSGQFTWPVNPQGITVRSSLCGSATSVVRSR